MGYSRRTIVVVVQLIAFATTVHAQATEPKNFLERPAARFLNVNGVKLHFLDWGGKGEPLLFLPALGGTADDFHPLAIRLTDRFRVLGLTRRGQGESAKPQSGYAVSQLVRDVKVFLTQLKIDRVTLVGYSMAGNELTEFAILYPRRVAKLVYLDAAYDLQENTELGRKARLNLPSLPGADRATLELIARSSEYRPDYTRIRAPALGVFVTYAEPPKSSMWDEATKLKLLAWWYDYGKAYRQRQIDRFRTEMKAGEVIELHNTTHAGFLFEEVQQDILIRELRFFLLKRR